MCACWRLIGCRSPSTLTFRSGESMFSSRRSLFGNRRHNFCASPSNLICARSPIYTRDLFSNLSSIELKAIPAEHIIRNVRRRTVPG